jgi:FtsP/CotA-like multicopper oxidase with cupredoxin domain
MLTRRQLVSGAGAVCLVGPATGGLRGGALGPEVAPVAGKTVAVELNAAVRPTALPCFGGAALPLWTFAEGAWPPLIRLQLGDRLEATLTNQLPRADETTSIHWHGVRLPNDQDGVPYLVQRPVRPGESFRYAFFPPDAGTFFFHTHCNTVEQLGRGLEGIFIIDGDVTEPYDADIVLLLRDWRIEPGTSKFASFSTLRGAGRAGTYGPLRSVNGANNPRISLPSSSDCRLRIINSDPTRIMRIGVDGADAVIAAIDGVAIPLAPLTTWTMGPGMRMDLVLRSPPPGGVASLVDSSAESHVELARLVGLGAPRHARPFDPAPLRAGRIPAPDLANATRISFRLQSSDAGAAIAATEAALGVPVAAICLSSRNFWSINGQSWPDRDHPRLPPPLAVLQRGRSYVLELWNDSDFSHPIHIHGHSLTFLRSDQRNLPAHHADTILLTPGERAEVAFVADNPGDWMFHCHVIEHQENGMMGYLRVI